MALHPIQIHQNNRKFVAFIGKEPVKSYLEASTPIETPDMVKPLPPQGYLIKDNIATSIKYYFKDMGYDLKAVKDGYKGTANDHQAGRLNDLGLKLGGVGIATYLASQTTNPKARVMEYVGLGTFLAAMSIYPKIAINLPARMRYGFDIDKQYIDDQGRKKSVMQDANYIPFDMYLGRVKSEDLSKIADKLGIPKDEPNRNEIAKDEMRKKSTQNHTLWMLTAAATPAITALACCGLENYVVAPLIEKAREAKYNKQIGDLLGKIKGMDLVPGENELGNLVKEKLSKFKDQEFTNEAFDEIYGILTKNLDNNISQALKKDLTKILLSGPEIQENAVVNSFIAEDFISVIKGSIGKQNKKLLEEVFVPSKEELETIIKQYTQDSKISENSRISMEKLPELRKALKELFYKRINNFEIARDNIEFFEGKTEDILNSIQKSLKIEKISRLSDSSIEEISKLASVLGDFKENYKLLDKCKSFKFEHAPETTLARAYEKFEKALLEELNFSYKELKLMRQSDSSTYEILDKKIAELCKDSVRYEKAVVKLAKVINEMEKSLHGEESVSVVQNLINAIGMNYDKAALRLNNVNSQKFQNTIRSLINENVDNLLSNEEGVIKVKETLQTKSQLIDMLDGLVEQTHKIDDFSNYVKENSRGLGSSKNNDIMRIVERYQGVKNSMHRILHSLDIYKRSMNPQEFALDLQGEIGPHIDEVISLSKKVLLQATSSNHALKLGTVNNPTFYELLMEIVWAGEKNAPAGVKQKGFFSEATKKAFLDAGYKEELERLQYYNSRFRNIVMSSDLDITKLEHIYKQSIRDMFGRQAKTRSSLFHLIAKTPVDFVREASNKKYNTQKWLRTVSAIVGSIFGVAFLTQLGFKKYTESKFIPAKQVVNEQN